MGAVLSNTFSEVHIGEGALADLSNLLCEEFSASKKFILVDSNTRKHCLPVLLKFFHESINYELIEIAAGEEHKSLVSCEKIWKALTAGEIDKHSVIISLGGGMIGDLGGFSAATILRGVKHIQVPTSLLAMVDASAGGKTGINLSGLKNQVGTFSHPLAIYIYQPFLNTLPERDFNSGLAEIAKHALIADAELWESFRKKKTFDDEDIRQFVLRSIEIKSGFVAMDEKDLRERHALNFGHTIGHAIEAFSLAKYELAFLHGEAVAVGMIAESYLSEIVSGLPTHEAEEIVNCLASRYHYLNFDFEPTQLMPYIKHDKKNKNSIPDFTLLPSIGSVKINQHTSEENIEIAIRKTRNLFLNPVV
ncbi:MAG: 3-dehydroquinate synthase [Bacteroidetes bacterium]|nr:MAG: 3-dehydroquinate synthase [Bacteroidota bacterium]